jgi:hypothetical protein
MLLACRVKNRAGKLGVNCAREHALERGCGAVPQFHAVRKLLGLAGDKAQPPGLGYALVHRGSLRGSRISISVLGAAPARDDTILVAQCDVTIRILTRRRVVRRITDAGIGGHRDNLLN